MTSGPCGGPRDTVIVAGEVHQQQEGAEIERKEHTHAPLKTKPLKNAVMEMKTKPPGEYLEKLTGVPT